MKCPKSTSDPFASSQIALDVAGVIDPSPISDGLGAINCILQKDYWGILFSGAAMIPWIGDTAKLGKIPRYLDTVRDAIKLALRSEKAAAVVRPALKRIDDLFRGIPLECLPDSLSRKLIELRDEVADGLKRIDAPSALKAAIARGMKIIQGPDAPDRMVGVLEKVGRPMSREQIREVIHAVKRKMNIAADEDLIFDHSGGLWDSRTGEYIGKMWEMF